MRALKTAFSSASRARLAAVLLSPAVALRDAFFSLISASSTASRAVAFSVAACSLASSASNAARSGFGRGLTRAACCDLLTSAGGSTAAGSATGCSASDVAISAAPPGERARSATAFASDVVRKMSDAVLRAPSAAVCASDAPQRPWQGPCCRRCSGGAAPARARRACGPMAHRTALHTPPRAYHSPIELSSPRETSPKTCVRAVAALRATQRASGRRSAARMALLAADAPRRRRPRRKRVYRWRCVRVSRRTLFGSLALAAFTLCVPAAATRRPAACPPRAAARRAAPCAARGAAHAACCGTRSAPAPLR